MSLSDRSDGPRVTPMRGVLVAYDFSTYAAAVHYLKETALPLFPDADFDMRQAHNGTWILTISREAPRQPKRSWWKRWFR